MEEYETLDLLHIGFLGLEIEMFQADNDPDLVKKFRGRHESRYLLLKLLAKYWISPKSRYYQDVAR